MGLPLVTLLQIFNSSQVRISSIRADSSFEKEEEEQRLNKLIVFVTLLTGFSLKRLLCFYALELSTWPFEASGESSGTLHRGTGRDTSLL